MTKLLWKDKFKDELRRFLSYSAFFTLFFWAFAIYRNLILEEYAISYLHYSYAFVESMILAKIIILGQVFGLGERFANKPLIIPTLYKTCVFSLFVLAFSILEHFVVGFFLGKRMSDITHELLSKGLDRILASLLVMFFVFVLFFAFLEIGRVMGDNRLFNLFVKRRHDLEGK